MDLLMLFLPGGSLGCEVTPLNDTSPLYVKSIVVPLSVLFVKADVELAIRRSQVLPDTVLFVNVLSLLEEFR